MERYFSYPHGKSRIVWFSSSDYQELARLMEEKQAEEEKLTGMMDEWEALSLQLEEGV